MKTDKTWIVGLPTGEYSFELAGTGEGEFETVVMYESKVGIYGPNKIRKGQKANLNVGSESGIGELTLPSGKTLRPKQTNLVDYLGMEKEIPIPPHKGSSMGEEKGQFPQSDGKTKNIPKPIKRPSSEEGWQSIISNSVDDKQQEIPLQRRSRGTSEEPLSEEKWERIGEEDAPPSRGQRRPYDRERKIPEGHRTSYGF